jgi:magnesium-transporting ATPase (P-type)
MQVFKKNPLNIVRCGTYLLTRVTKNYIATYFDADVETVVALFKTSVERGLTNAEVLARREHYGQNLLPKPKKKSIWVCYYFYFGHY